MTPDHRIYKVPMLLLLSLTGINVGIMAWLKVLTDSFWGWRVADLDKTPAHFLIDGIAVLNWFHSRKHAKVLIEQWREHYNTIRPHSSLDYQTPLEYVSGWKSSSTTGAFVSK